MYFPSKMDLKSPVASAPLRQHVENREDRLTRYLRLRVGEARDALVEYVERKATEWLYSRGKVFDSARAAATPNKLAAMTTEEAESMQQAELRRNCSWFQYFRISFFFSVLVQGIPFKLIFDPKTQTYQVITSNLRKAVWVIFHSSSVVIFWTDAMKTIHEIRQSHDTLLYFELMVVLGYFAFDYPFKYKWLFRIDNVAEFFHELQTSPLLKIASKKTFTRAFLYTTFYTWYFSTIFTFFLLHWNVYFFDLGSYYDTMKVAMETYYGIPMTAESQWWYPLVMFVAFFFVIQHTGFSHCCDLISITGILTMNLIAHDIDKAIKENKLDDDEVLVMMGAQKRLTKKFNRAFGLLVCVYVTYCSPYYSLHSIDMFAVPGIINWLNTFTYVIVLGLGCKWAIDCIILARRRKRWLVAKDRALRIEHRKFAFLLDDISWEKYGLGQFFEVNSFVSGEIASLLITVAVIRIQM